MFDQLTSLDVTPLVRQLTLFRTVSRRAKPMCLLFLVLFLAASTTVSNANAEELLVNVEYIEQRIERPVLLSSLISWPEDEGLAGARLALADNNTTGKFLKHAYQLNETVFPDSQSTIDGARKLLQGSAKLVVVNADANTLLQIASMDEAQDDLIFNARSQNNALRDADCRANVFHTSPSRRMLSDALMQFITKRRWQNLFLIEGNKPGDKAFATSLRESAKKFGAKIKHDKLWLVDADIRRNASQEVPLFTQEKKYDVILVSDEANDFSQYLLYNTWLPRPIAGSAGLSPTGWSAVMEQWGALQLQTRFDELASRPMNAPDYANWAALRSIGEAVTRTQSSEPAVLKNYLLSDAFSLAAFKGKKMSYRDWNGQLRQPIPLVHAKAVVAMAPLEGYLHQRTELDTLGTDKAESACTAF